MIEISFGAVSKAVELFTEIKLGQTNMNKIKDLCFAFLFLFLALICCHSHEHVSIFIISIFCLFLLLDLFEKNICVLSLKKNRKVD